jgi:hypothetical protein
MSTIVTRAGKGSPLTYNEVDTNFTNLNTDKIQSGDTVAQLTVNSINVTGGSINGTNIGASTAGIGGFSNLSYTGTLTGSTGILNIGSGQIYKDASGNVGIGTNSPVNFGSTFKVLTTEGSTGGYVVAKSGTTQMSMGGESGAGAGGYVGTSSNHPVTFTTNATARMIIDANGNVGIGTSSPELPLDVQNSGDSQIRARETGAGVDLRLNAIGGVGLAGVVGTYSAHPLVFFSNATERMRITANGEVWIAGNTDQGAYNLQCNGTGVWGAGAYVNGSDARIKEDITPLTSGLDVVKKLNPVTYRYKEDWSNDRSVQPGFIAQELLEALDGTDYVDGVVMQGGTEGYYSVAYQNIMPILTKAIQEQQAIIEDLKSRIEALENGLV